MVDKKHPYRQSIDKILSKETTMENYNFLLTKHTAMRVAIVLMLGSSSVVGLPSKTLIYPATKTPYDSDVSEYRRYDSRSGTRYVDATNDAIRANYEDVNLNRYFGPLTGDRIGRNVMLRLHRGDEPPSEFAAKIGSRKQIFTVNKDRYRDYFDRRNDIVNRVIGNIDPFDGKMKESILRAITRALMKNTNVADNLLKNLYKKLLEQKVSLSNLDDEELNETFASSRVMADDLAARIGFEQKLPRRYGRSGENEEN